ncbi:deubiquitinating protein VCPIP1-like [Ciona intestinalis]
MDEEMLDIEADGDVYDGKCPDAKCQTLLYFYLKTSSVECTSCGQHHKQESLLNKKKADQSKALQSMISRIIHDQPKKGSDFVRVNGLSNFTCKLLSPFLTTYGMNKAGKATLLSELCNSEIIDCGKVLGSRSFHISPTHIDVEGYGKDRTGSINYLQTLLDTLKTAHNNEERLIPIHADGDGHCLVHALSRALIGRELFWHGLRINLQNHLKEKLEQYKIMFKEFHDDTEWDGIIEEADPYCTAGGVAAGLGNIHIFALSNILKRPIMLLDSMKNLQNAGDYTGLFVPVMVEPDDCLSKSPICIAWSGGGHNHFVALVAVEGKTLPHIPKHLVPRIWGVSQEVGQRYLTFNSDGSLTVCAGKPLKISYTQKLVSAMEELFTDSYKISPTLVAEYYQKVYRPTNMIGIRPDIVTKLAKNAITKKSLFHCLMCESLQEKSSPPLEDLCPGGQLYLLLVDCHGPPIEGKVYSFPLNKLKCVYNQSLDRLTVHEYECSKCGTDLRPINGMGEISYKDGDATSTPSAPTAKCMCGKKHYWGGREYDNLPGELFLPVEWGDKTVRAKVIWFYGDSNPSYNSDAEIEAQKIVDEHFDGLFGTEHLIQRIATQIHIRCIELGLDVGGDSYDMQIDHHEPPCKTFVKRKENSLVTSKKRSVKEDKNKAAENIPLLSSSPDSKPSSPKLNGKPKIKLHTSEESTTVEVDADTELNELKTLAYQKFNIPVDQQILKHGYPPKPLEPANGPLGLTNGDSIKVERKSSTITKHPKFMSNKNIEEMLPMILKQPAQHGSVLQSISDTFQPSAPEIPLSEALKNIRTEQSRSIYKTMWDFAVSQPHLFTPGGVFYRQFQSDIGLEHDKHCKLPLIPDKLFLYNRDEDRVELCLEPYGHFPVNQDVVEHLKQYEINQSAPQIRMGPGFHMLGDAPTILPEEDQAKSREQLSKLVQEIKRKNSS